MPRGNRKQHDDTVIDEHNEEELIMKLDRIDKQKEKADMISSINENVIWDTRLDIIQYCDENFIPLCDYLDHETFVDFIQKIKR